MELRNARTASGTAATGLTLDDAGALYVTVCHYCSRGSRTGRVRAFPPKAKGNAKPKAIVVGSKTELDAPTDLVVLD